MTTNNAVTEVVEAEGHLIDSQLMNAMFDTVVRHDAAFDVLEFRIGRTNDEPSFVSMRVTAKAPAALTDVLEGLIALGCRVARAEDAHLVIADRDGCAPEDFYSTTNHQTHVRIGGQSPGPALPPPVDGGYAPSRIGIISERLQIFFIMVAAPRKEQ